MARERFSRPAVVHVTTTVLDDLPNLRERTMAQMVARALWLAARRERQARPGWLDPLSTACWFDGYRDREADDGNPWPTADTFLLTVGWHRGRGGRFSVNDIPGKRR